MVRPLARDRHSRYRPVLASLLDRAGTLQGMLENYDVALVLTGEAVGLFRDLIRLQPEVHLRGLAIALGNYGVCLDRLSRHEEATMAFAEAVDAWRRANRYHNGQYSSQLIAGEARLRGRPRD